MRLVAFDCETEKFIPGNQTPRLVCGSFAYHAYIRSKLGSRDETLREVKRLLFDTQTIICGAHIAFDFAIVCNEDPELIPLVFEALEQGRVWDVLIAATLHEIAENSLTRPLRLPNGKQKDRYSLELAVFDYLGRNNAKENDFWRLRYGILRDVPLDDWPAEARRYPLDDAENTLDVALVQRGESAVFCNAPPKPTQNAQDVAAQCRADFALYLSAIWGQRTDKKAIDALDEKFNGELQKQLEIFKKHGFFRPDGTKDTARIGAAVSEAYLGSPPLTATGKIAIDRDTLEQSGDEILEALGAVSATQKIINSYLPFLREGEEKPITGRPNVLVASGRASYKGLDQTIPRGSGLRECFVFRPGWVGCSVDYSALELHTLAQCQVWMCGQSSLAEALNGGLDPHCAFAASMLGLSYEEFMLVFSDKKHEKQAYYKKMRQAAKAANFGFPGGMGAAKLVLAQRKIGLRFCQTMILDGEPCGAEKVTQWKGREQPPLCKKCVQLAEELKFQWLRRWPEMTRYFQLVNSFAQSGVITQFVSERVRGCIGFSDGANTLFQGLAADGAKAALFAVSRACYDASQESVLYNTARPILFAHDEIISELVESRANLTAREIARIMIHEMQRFTPDLKIKAEPALMRRWYKDAEPVYDNGILVPWEPKKG